MARRTPSAAARRRMSAEPVAVGHQRALGDLEPEPRRLAPRRGRARRGPSRTRSGCASWRAERLTRQLDGVVAELGAASWRSLRAGLASRTQLPDRDDEPGLLGERDEVDRRDAGRARDGPSGPAPRTPATGRSRSSTIGLVDAGEARRARWRGAARCSGRRGARPTSRASPSSKMLDAGSGPGPWPGTWRRRRRAQVCRPCPRPRSAIAMPTLTPSRTPRRRSSDERLGRTTSAMRWRPARARPVSPSRSVAAARRTRRRRSGPRCRPAPAATRRRWPTTSTSTGRRRRGRGESLITLKRSRSRNRTRDASRRPTRRDAGPTTGGR